MSDLITKQACRDSKRCLLLCTCFLMIAISVKLRVTTSKFVPLIIYILLCLRYIEDLKRDRPIVIFMTTNAYYQDKWKEYIVILEVLKS